MSSGSARPFVSVKFSPAGRTYAFLLPELALDAESPDAEPDVALAASDPPPMPFAAPGEPIVVQTSDGRAMGTVTRTIPALAERRCPPADSEARVVRRATRDDVVSRLKHQEREKEAHRISLMKIRERGLPMKLARTEQLFDGSRLIFYYTAEGRVDFRELVRDLAAHFRASWSGTSRRTSAPGLRCGRLACATKPRCWAATDRAGGRSAAPRSSRRSSPSRSRWRSSRT